MGFEVNGRVFRSGNSVAVRLPKEFGYAVDDEVKVRQLGGTVVIERRGKPSLSDMIETLRDLPGPGEIQRRDPIEVPERAVL